MGNSFQTATGNRGLHSACNYHATKLLSSNSLYLLLDPSSTELARLAKVEKKY